MKNSILSTILLALTISLTATVASTNLNLAFAIEDYLELTSASVNYHGEDIDVDIRTGDDIPSEKGNSGFGYAVLTDVGDEFVNNVLVAISDIGIESYDDSTENDKLHTYVFDLTGDISRDCSGSDYEVSKSSSDNDAFDTNYPIDVEDDKISIDDVDTDDLDSDTVKAIASFTAEAITHNDKIQHVCIDIQDRLKQSEVGVSYDNNDNYEEDNDNNDDNDYDYDDDKNEKDYDTEKDYDDDLFEIDTDQIIDQINECDDESDCSNEGRNEANLFGFSYPGDEYEFDFDFDQIIDQINEGGNDGSNDKNIDIDQRVRQNNDCDEEASCSNEGYNEANVIGYPTYSDDRDLDSNVDIEQSIEQSNSCNGGSTCSNFASNIVNVD